MKFVALKELPQGQQPGEVFETNEDIGNVLILVGAAKKWAEDPVTVPQEPAASSARGRYRRTDLKAESE